MALLASLFGGSLAAQPPAPFKLAVPAAYQPRTPAPSTPAKPQRPGGVVNPAADRAPMLGSTSGRVLYFQKPADAMAPSAGPPITPTPTHHVTTIVHNDLVPSVLPQAMSPADQRLALAPTDPPRFVNDSVPTPAPAELPAAAPAAARADEPPAYLPVSTPSYEVPQVPSASVPDLPQIPGIPVPGGTHTAQKKQDLTRPLDRTDWAQATRLPARDKIFVLYNDAELEQAIVTSVRNDVMRIRPGERVIPKGNEDLYRFPELSPLVPPGTVYQAKTASYPPRTECIEPAYVVHRRLNFEQKNFERGGWDLGIVQPVVSTFVFYKDVLFWPHNLASGIHNCWDTSAGKCLPGSPTPFYLYPPEFTVTGSLTEAALVTATVFIIP